MGLFYAALKSAQIKSAPKTARLFISMGEKSGLFLPRRFHCISSIHMKMAKLKRSLLLACVAEQLHLEDTLINLCVAQLKSKKRQPRDCNEVIQNQHLIVQWTLVDNFSCCSTLGTHEFFPLFHVAISLLFP